MPPNFQNGKIYAIRSHQTDKIYIGSTTQPLSVRFGGHKRTPCSSREILQFDDCYIELLEEFPCENKMQLTKREGLLIRSMDCVNKQIPNRTKAEHYQDNKEHFLQYKHQYYVDNNTEIKEKQNQQYNCFCNSKYTLRNKARHFKTDNHLECIRQLSA
jgi:hypothetical protein